MLDIKYILDHLEEVREISQKRQVQADLDGLVACYTERKNAMLSLENKRAEANRIAKTIPIAAATDKQALIDQGRSLNQEISKLEETVRQLEDVYQTALYTIPNLLAPDTPLGATDEENVVLRKHLEPRVFEFQPKDHLELGKALDIIDFDSGAKVTGSKFYFLKNDAVLLELALQLFALKVAKEFGYTQLITPDMAKKSVLIGTGYSPRGEESNIYNVEDLDLSLIATAEITVGGIHSGEILEEAQLPLKYVALSHCFRREAGSAGKKYDIEAWMPGRDSAEKYGEVTSASNCTDFQSRRLNMRYRTSDNSKRYPYTLNGTAIALSRTLIAILENYQEADGSIRIPEVLQAYMGKTCITAEN